MINPANKAILGKKLGNTQIFTEDGIKIAVTVLELGPATVIQKKTKEKDGYSSVQLGYGDKKEKHINKPQAGHFKKAGISPKRFIKEVRFNEEVSVEVGKDLTIDQFNKNDFIDVVSYSKGKGFAGVMKKYNFSGRPATHGTHENFRGPGSVGMHQDPGRVIKGKKMPGHMGNKRVTIQNLKIVQIDKEKNIALVKGTVPGSKNSFVLVRDAVKKS